MKMDLIHNKIGLGTGVDNADDKIHISSNPSLLTNGVLNLKTSTSNTLHIQGSSVTLVIPKQYTIDMAKVLESKDIESKLNTLLSIFSEMNITIQDYAMTDTLRKYCKEI